MARVSKYDQDLAEDMLKKKSKSSRVSIKDMEQAEKLTGSSKGTAMPRGKARYEAVEVFGPEVEEDTYMVGRREDRPGRYGYEKGPMIKGEKEAGEYASEVQRETRGFKMGGMVNVRGQGAARKTKGCKIC